MERTNAVDEEGIGLKSPTQVQWVVMNSVSDHYSESSFEDSAGTTSDDDASSSSFGPLDDLSQLFAQLPITRGLSKYYQGKSQSFGRLGSVMSLEDLPKEGNSSYNKRMKSCKSLDGRIIRSSFGPKATITKKSYSRRPILSLRSDTNTDIVGTCTSSISLERNF